ncbi:MAG: DNA polymerase III subunit alpha [candidate division KSB1 bacterium]|nr:DNA polymerase III subunit alpha [candidate division KSB1 bacterium]
MPFTHLHVHSHYSFCRGTATLEDLCRTAKQRGFTHLALTDRNGLYGLGNFLMLCKNYHLQPIIGACFETPIERAVLLAKNAEGYSALCMALTQFHRHGIDLALWFVQHGRDLVLLTDDLRLLQKLKDADAEGEYYAELIPHRGAEAVLRFAREKRIPIVATNAVHMLDKEDWEVHRLLRAIDLNTTLTRIPQEELISVEAYLKTAAQMQADFPHCPEAIDNSQRIAQSCTFSLDLTEFIFPEYRGPNGESAEDYLRRRVEEGVLRRYGGFDERIRKRLDYELAVICEKRFAPYFLVVADIVAHAPRTCGRGSAAASLVSYCLGITHVDPLKYDLFFDRFLNPGRIDPPDIDVDFPWDERDDILDYIFRRFGHENVAMIANHVCFAPRSAVREIAKVYGLPENEIRTVTSRLAGLWQPSDIWQTTQTHPLFRSIQLHEPWPTVIRLAERIRDYPRHLSIHCGGVVIVPRGVSRYVPTQPAHKVLKLTGAVSGLPREEPHRLHVIQWEKDQAEEMKLVKMDILGNRSLAVIRDALAAVEENTGTRIDYAQWDPLEDPKVQQALAQGDTIGVFYIESPAMRLLQKKTGVGDFEHIVIHSSIIRPAANRFINEYIRRLKGGAYTPLHPLLEELLRETYGIMVYQEDVSRVAMTLAGFSAAEADELRKILSKKHKQRSLQDFRAKFYAGAQARGVDAKTCDQIWEMILSFSGYSFCKAHSASYAQVSFKSAYLRVYYPAEFMAAVISNQGGYYSTFAYISEARRMGLKILPPDINLSDYAYRGRDREIRVGLMQLKGITRETIERLLRERRKNGAFRSLYDFMMRVQPPPNDAAVLIKAGCFDAVEKTYTRPQLLWKSKAIAAEQGTGAAEPTLSLFGEADVTAVPNIAEYDEETLLDQEIETLGFLLSRHPLERYRRLLCNLSYIPAKDLAKHVGKTVTTVGWFVTGKTTATSQEELMEFVSFEDTTALYETVFFPKTYSRFIHLLSYDRPFLLHGQVQSEFGAVTLHVNSVEPLEK